MYATGHGLLINAVLPDWQSWIEGSICSRASKVRLTVKISGSMYQICRLCSLLESLMHRLPNFKRLVRTPSRTQPKESTIDFHALHSHPRAKHSSLCPGPNTHEGGCVTTLRTWARRLRCSKTLWRLSPPQWIRRTSTSWRSCTCSKGNMAAWRASFSGLWRWRPIKSSRSICR